MVRPRRQFYQKSRGEIGSNSYRLPEVQENPCDWASCCLNIIRVCKAYGYSKAQNDKLFGSLIMYVCTCVFLYAIEIWGVAYQRKHLDRIDNF